MRDLMDELAAVERRVAEGEVPAGPAHVVALARTYRAPRADVWDALTEPDRLARWFLPVSGDLVLGGRYQFEGNAGGVVRQCERPDRLVVTWEMGPVGALDASLVEVTLREVPGGTRLHLEHRAQVPPEFWDRFGPGSVGVGWDGGLLGLALYLGGEELPSTEDLGSDPALRAFNTASARAWGEAHRAAGADPATVASGVAATTQFYVPALAG